MYILVCNLCVDPVVGGEVVAAGIGCDIPSLLNPYDAGSQHKPTLLWGIVAIMLVMGIMN